MIYNPYDHYFNKAKQQGYKARSAFKLEEIQNKFKLIDKNTKTILDIGCAPGSWMQYTSGLLTSMKVNDFQIIGFDIKESTVNLPNVHTYIQDVTDT
ncbi:MAG TPA: SAM-dependent methyltransferase, partial [Candidatus Absconditabacterales bacterium]|nr:SAM-dependent methyltransferase [Candidatus Absconditabacterales bacterium]